MNTTTNCKNRELQNNFEMNNNYKRLSTSENRGILSHQTTKKSGSRSSLSNFKSASKKNEQLGLDQALNDDIL